MEGFMDPLAGRDPQFEKPYRLLPLRPTDLSLYDNKYALHNT